MAANKVFPGAQFGRLRVVERTGEVRHGRPVLMCLCDCGNTVKVVSGSLLRGDTKSCGCFRRERMSTDRPHQDMVGRIFGRLTVVAKSPEKIGREYAWSCLCACGGTTVVRGGALRFGHTQSCGCMTREAVSAATSADLAGQRFGRLLVVERTGSKGGAALWRCLCDCGAECEAMTGPLNAGNRVSCGCASLDKPGLRSTKSRANGAAYGNARRAHKKKAGGKFTADQIDRLHEKQKGKCANCGAKLGDKYHRDHRVPLSKGGSNDISNIELLCGPCNLVKRAKDPIEWAQENGRLI